MMWTDQLPREYYAKYRRLPVDDRWFSVYQLFDGVFAICEPRHFQEVNSYLITGKDRAVLLDTGMARGDIFALSHRLYGGPIDVVNTHFHFDHVSENYKFERVFSYDEPHALEMHGRGYSNAELMYQIGDDMFWGGVPAWLDRQSYHIPGKPTIPVKEGHVFDLGGRRLQVLHTPGHTKDCLMLHDEQNGLLFTGDTFYLGTLYAQFDNTLYGYSDVEEYARSIGRLCSLIPTLRHLCCSHNDMVVPPNMLLNASDALGQICLGRAVSLGNEAGLHKYDKDESDIALHKFGAFSILTKKQVRHA